MSPESATRLVLDMAGKRHRYLPTLHLRRLAEVSGQSEGLVWGSIKRATGGARQLVVELEPFASGRRAPMLERCLGNGTRLQLLATVRIKGQRFGNATRSQRAPSSRARSIAACREETRSFW
jgi:hypothetical protein